MLSSEIGRKAERLDALVRDLRDIASREGGHFSLDGQNLLRHLTADEDGGVRG